MRINVSKKDIEQGQKLSECYCPIALAIKRKRRKQKKSTFVSVGGNEVHLDNWDMKEYLLPKAARDFVNRFDDGKDVSPFSFRMTRSKD